MTREKTLIQNNHKMTFGKLNETVTCDKKHRIIKCRHKLASLSVAICRCHGSTYKATMFHHRVRHNESSSAQCHDSA